MKSIQYLSQPAEPVRGEINVPGDKSISHRSIMLGAIAEGITKVQGFLDGEDCMATLNIFKKLGVQIEGPVEQELLIYGVGKHGLNAPTSSLDCGNSGTSIRLLAGLMSGQSFDSTLTGDSSLLKRPMGRVSKPLRQMGAEIHTHEEKPPLSIIGGKSLNGIHYAMPEASAQVKSCLLLAGLYAQSETVLIEPRITRDHTERMLQAFSCALEKKGNMLILPPHSVCKATEISIPGDISSAAFFMVAASIVPDSELFIHQVGINPARTGVIHILKEMGADIEIIDERYLGREPVADILIKYAPLKGINIAPELVPLAIDEFPAICIAAACAQGITTIHGAAELRVKESDRIAAMVDGLQILGIKAQAFADGLSIEGGRIQGGTVDSLGDHRISMAFAIAGQVASASVKIKDCNNVRTSFPNFIPVSKISGMDIKETYHAE